MTKTHNIEVEGLPEGWRAVAFRVPSYGESIIDFSGDLRTVAGLYQQPRLIVEKIKPRSIKVENTGEIRQPREGEYVYNNGNLCLCRKPERWGNEHQIWRVVEEVERSSTTFRERVINDLVHNSVS